jgi:hypothetical protein
MTPRTTPPFGENESSIETLTVAMALAPGVYTRNRMFDFFAHPAVQRARSRAATLRGIVRQLARAKTVVVTNEGQTVTGVPTYVLRYSIPEMRLSRVAELTQAELAALRLMSERARVRALPAADEDRLIVAETLKRLMAADAGSRDLAEAAARDSGLRDAP